jgi:hypothetical protein
MFNVFEFGTCTKSLPSKPRQFPDTQPEESHEAPDIVPLLPPALSYAVVPEFSSNFQKAIKPTGRVLVVLLLELLLLELLLATLLLLVIKAGMLLELLELLLEILLTARGAGSPTTAMLSTAMPLPPQPPCWQHTSLFLLYLTLTSKNCAGR